MPVRTLRINQPERSKWTSRTRPCGPRAGLLLPKRPHSPTVLSCSPGVAGSRRLDGGRFRGSAAAPSGAGGLWAELRNPAPAGRPAPYLLQPDELHARNFPLAKRRGLRSVLTPARSAAGPASPSQTPAPPTHPVRSALPPRGPGSRPGTRSPAPRAPPPRPPAHARRSRAGARRAPTGLTLRPGGGREAGALGLGEHEPDQGD